MATLATDGRPVTLPPLKIVSEATRQRETFKYDSSLLTTLRVNDGGVPLPRAELATSQDLVLTSLAQLAVLQTGTERALISLFDQEYQYVIAEATGSLHLTPSRLQPARSADLWMCGTAIPRAHGLCEYALLARDPTQFEFCDTDHNQPPVLVVPDVATDPRFSAKPYCQPGNPVRFYASVPIRTKQGINIGVLCTVSPGPEAEWSEHHSQLLRNLAVTIMEHLEANRSKIAHRRSERMVRGLGFFVEGKSMSSSWHSIPGRPTFTDSQDALNLARQALLQEQVDQVDVLGTPQSGRSLSPVLGPGERLDSGSKKDRSASRRNLDDSAVKVPAETKWAEDFQPGPNPMAETFSEAANIIRESLETDGCLFLDGTLGSFGAFDSRPHESKRTNPSDQPSSPSPSSGSSSSSGGGSDDDQGSSSAEPLWPPCQVLAYSSDHPGHPKMSSCRNASMAQKFLAKLLQRYPKGHIFNFDANGELQSSDSSDDDGWMAEPVSPHQLGRMQPDASQAKRQKRPWARQNEGRVILQVFPGARSVAFVPVWDPRKQRWCAGGFVYTLTPTRIFTVEGELNYLRAFGILAIAETLRLKTLAANQAKSDALSSLSHELRSPLHGAVLGIELLRDTELSVFQGNVAHTIETCCRTLVDTVDHLLDYSKVNRFIQARRKEKQEAEPRGLRPGRARSVEAGMLSLYKHVKLDGLVEEVMDGVYAGFNFQHMSVTQLAKQKPTSHSDLTAIRRLDSMQAMEELGPNISDKGDVKLAFGEVSVFLDIDPTCSWEFYTQPGAIRRIVMNLFGNALKYTRKGTIKVCLNQTTPKSSTPSTESMVNITVADTGKGMSDDYLRNELYKPFSQEDHLAPGTGLGLSFVKQITSQLRGHVAVQSRVAVGTTVHVSLPLTRTLSSPNLPLPSDSEGDFERQILEITGLRIRLMGFDAHRRAERPMLNGADAERHTLVERICREWLHLDVLTDSDVKQSRPNLVLWTEEAFAKSPTHEETLIGPPGVVMCKNALIAYKSAAHYERIKGRRVFEFVPQPLGPRKLSKALSLAFKRWKELQALPLSPLSPEPASINADILDGPTRVSSPSPAPRLMALRNRAAEKAVLLSPAFDAVPEFLLVEDNSINLNILSIYMKKLGRPYHTATNGAEAFEAYRANPEHCKYIFMDISMPIMDGFEATRCIRAYERENQLKPAIIFALTGLASESAQQEALGSGVDLFLTKPVKLKELGLILKSRGLLIE